MQHLTRRLAILLSGLSLAGCGGSGEEVVPARGRVLLNGEPLQVRGRDVGLGSVKVEFYRLGEEGAPSDAPEGMVVDERGYFELPGRDGRGIPPGKYRVAVYQYDPHPEDKLGGRFGKDNSPIVVEVSGKEDLAIELSEYEG